MNFLKSLKWWHWVLIGAGVVSIFYAWKKFRSHRLSVDTIESEIRIGPTIASVSKSA